MKNWSILFSSFICICWNTIHAQVEPPIEWQQCLGGSFIDEAAFIQQVTDGGFIVADPLFQTMEMSQEITVLLISG
jgi:hypothetical protein